MKQVAVAPDKKGQGQQQNEIDLPESREIRASIFYAAAVSLQYELFTKYPYQIELKDRIITSLSNLPRDVRKAIVDDLAARKRDHGLIDETPSESIIRRPPNILVAFLVLVVGAAIVFYLQVNTDARDRILMFWNANEYAIIGTALVFMLFFLVIAFTRRRKSRKV